MGKKKELPQRKRLAAIFVSFTILLVGSTSLLETMSLDYYSVLGTLEKIIPASLAMGALGWVMGMVLDKPKRRHQISYNNLFLNEVSKNVEEPSITDDSGEEEKEDDSTETPGESL